MTKVGGLLRQFGINWHSMGQKWLYHNYRCELVSICSYHFMLWIRNPETFFLKTTGQVLLKMIPGLQKHQLDSWRNGVTFVVGKATAAAGQSCGWKKKLTQIESFYQLLILKDWI